MSNNQSNQRTLELCIYDYVTTEDHNGNEVYVVYYQHGIRGNDPMEITNNDNSVWLIDEDWKTGGKDQFVAYSTIKLILNRINARDKLWVEDEDGRNACRNADKLYIEFDVVSLSATAKKKIANEYFSTPVEFK